MSIRSKSLILATLIGVSALALGGCHAAAGPYNGSKTNHYGPYYQGYNAANHGVGRYNGATPAYNQGYKSTPKYKNLRDQFQNRKTLAHQVQAPPGQFQQWVEYEPYYTLYPGDQLDIVIASAPELSRTLTVGPDGRINMPMVAPIMAAGRSLPQVQTAIQTQLASQLRDPATVVTARAFAPEQIYVGGDVGAPGTYTAPGRIGALEAIIMAGGVRPSSNAKRVAVLRRAPNGGMMLRTVNIKNGIRNIREYDDNIQLRRGDIIFVPRSTLGEVGVFSENLRNAIPFDLNFSYQFGNGDNQGTTILSP